ncbi:hypothetical protein EXIGLDRAFT_773090 [Exidia glandulosa HHB12029]|uniref:Uncharacterized protein n=1 Tax=Exidia glandulosa HHB12029 TaxID=1314781 RepID=A0A165EZA2_EXIGL|nr:hypothetical protein EXIGLDRAFT_773090 [Exidia glandulosa HHB12029]
MVVWSSVALVSGKYQLVYQLNEYLLGLWATLVIVLTLHMLVVQANLMFRPAQL